ncbi:MAG: ATP-NAD kinase [Rhodothermaceae bacterium]|nr:ATP-NAD kinase [Rhodothermaceae bacterium]MYF64185.1 ATP-NAD kinase [Rhodothermaceae bacterium]MYI84862.1 ATP-NAD kinase [Rhodothermaceae bacterium]
MKQLIYGITGNTAKDELWPLVRRLKNWMDKKDIGYRLHASIVDGLLKRSMITPENAEKISINELTQKCDVILSIGGDGTLLHTAFEVGTSGIPILGINIGRLGFLADVEASKIQNAMRLMEEGRYMIEERMVLDLSGPHTGLALNDIVITRKPGGGLAAIDIQVDATRLNRYWGDGLIIATPTGSTAYSLAVGGPIVMPGSNVVIVSPVAPHSLTVRPIVLPAQAVLTIQLAAVSSGCTIALDGRTHTIAGKRTPYTVRRANHSIRLIRLENMHYFSTLRSKLSWGMGPQMLA